MKQHQQQQTMVTSAGPVQPVNSSQPYRTTSLISSYRHRQSTLSGALMVIAGSLSIIFSIIMIADVAKHSSYAALIMANGGGNILCGITVSNLGCVKYVTSD